MSPDPGAGNPASPAPAHPAWSRWVPAVALAALFLLGVGYVAFQALCAPGVAFLAERPPARWITWPLVPEAHLRSGENVDLAVAFRRDFELSRAPEGPVRVRLRAFRRFEAFVNGERVGGRESEASWKSATTLEIGPELRAGRNSLRVRVRSRYGPPALWLVTEGLAGASEAELRSGAGWSASLRGGPAREARIADDTRPFPASLQGPDPMRALREHFGVLLGVFALALLAFRGLRELPQRQGAPAALRALGAHPAEAVLVLSLLVWTGLAVHNFSAGHVQVGFDAPSHIAYVEHLLEHRALPPTDRAMEATPEGGLAPRWENHQPPFFYLLAAGALGAARAVLPADAAERWLRLVPLASGLGSVLLAWAAARLALPRSAPARAAAVAFAASIPMNVYIAHYVSNESLSALGIGGSLTLCAWLLVRERPGVGGFLALGLVAGLTLMTKATFGMLFPVLLALLVAKLLLRDGFAPAPAAGRVAATLALAVPLGGWFYLRSWILFGTPLVLPWEGRMGFEWWQDPGYHTAAWFLSFGRVFSDPFFAGTYSFLDSLYATFWGDAFVGGLSAFGVRGQPPWRWELMAAVYPLAVPATLLVAVGALRGVVRVVRRGDLVWTLLLAAAFLSALSLVQMNLRIPYFAQAKSFYALGALVPLALMGGAGFGWVDDRLHTHGGPWLASALRAYLATLGFAVAASFLATSGS